MPRGPTTSRGFASRRPGSSPSDTCWARTWRGSSSARNGSGTSSSALEPFVDLLARRHPDALVLSDVIVDRLEIFDPVRHPVDVGVHGDRHDARVPGAFE